MLDTKNRRRFLGVKERMKLHYEKQMKLHYGCIPLVLSHKRMSGLLLNCYRIVQNQLHRANSFLSSSLHIYWIKVKVRFRPSPNKSNHSSKANNEENAYQTNFITDFDLYEAFQLHSTLKLEARFVVDTL